MRVTFAVLLSFASLTLHGASRPLNPLVPRLATSDAVTTECAEGTTFAPEPRIDVADIPEPERSGIEMASMPPPSSSLRVQFQEAQAALAREDRRTFSDALARIRATLADYPPGGEKSAAQNVLGVYEDVAVLWEAQFQSPFFAEESAAYRAASDYPGWAEGVRRNILVDDRDHRFYPARESRQYLAGVAATRLQRLGVERDEPRTALPAIRPRRGPGKVETHVAAATPKPAPRRTATPKPRATYVAPAPKPAPPVIIPPPVARPVQTATTDPVPVETAPPPAPDTVATTAPLAAPETTDTTVTTATEAARANEPAKSRPLIVPIILILVGLGVLIVLFRTSS